MPTRFKIEIDLTMPGDDAEDELEELQETISVWMMDNPFWTVRVDIVEHK